MEHNVWKIVGAVAGIGGIAIASVVYIFREVIRREIFPQLTKEQAFKLINRIITYTFIIGILGITAYIVISLYNGTANPPHIEPAPSLTPSTSNNVSSTQPPSPTPSTKQQKTNQRNVNSSQGGQNSNGKLIIIDQKISNSNPTNN